MSKYTYIVEAIGNADLVETYSYQNAASLRASLELIAEKAKNNGDYITLKTFKKEFRKPSMQKVGFNCTKELANGTEIESRYIIYRYHYTKPIPVPLTAP